MDQDIKTIQKNILSWYAKNGRKLPRRQTVNPYAIHISEVMLQQTQVDRVIPYFHQRMKDFPDYASLAKASKTQLLSHRSGLGFNSRALRLQSCAQTIIEKWKNGEWKNWTLSKDRDELQKLPGIWPYTSAAIMAFARNLPVPVIDTNIRRVLIFLFKERRDEKSNIPENFHDVELMPMILDASNSNKVKKLKISKTNRRKLPETITAKALESFAETIIPKWKSRDRHNALMDQGALLLTARKTKIKPLSKQSTFEWSDRQVRGWTMKQLIKHWTLKIKHIEEEFPHKQIKKIMKDLQKEGLIQIKKWIVLIAE